MPKEYEYRFLFGKSSAKHLSVKSFRKQLVNLGAKHTKPVLYKINTYHCPTNDKLYVRIRDEGYRITFTIKNENNRNYPGRNSSSNSP